MPIEILLADGHVIVRDGLRMLLESRGELKVVGTASDGAAVQPLHGGRRHLGQEINETVVADYINKGRAESPLEPLSGPGTRLQHALRWAGLSAVVRQARGQDAFVDALHDLPGPIRVRGRCGRVGRRALTPAGRRSPRV